MSITKRKLSQYLSRTINLLENTSRYEWGNSGACNCGHLAQAMTGKTRAEIHEESLKKSGEDWSEKARVYCENSGYEIDDIIKTMIHKGLQIDDIHHIEYLSHPAILNKVEGPLSHNNKDDVITYFHAWIKLLSDQEFDSSESWISTKKTQVDEVEVHDTVPEFVN